MAALSVAPATIVPAIEHANQRLPAGEFASANQEFAVQTGEFLRSADDVGAVVVGVSGGHPIYLRDVATIRDGPEEPANYVLFGLGNVGAPPVGATGNQAETTAGTRRAPAGITGDSPAVTIAISKRKGKNAVVSAWFPV